MTSLAQYGFKRISEDVYLHSETCILLTDVAPRNVRFVEGNPVLFDAIASLAGENDIEWAASQERTKTRGK